MTISDEIENETSFLVDYFWQNFQLKLTTRFDEHLITFCLFSNAGNSDNGSATEPHFASTALNDWSRDTAFNFALD